MADEDRDRLQTLRSQARWIGDLFRLSLRLLEEDAPVLSVIVHEAARMLGAPMAAVDVLHRELVYAKESFGLPPALQGAQHAPDQTFSGRVIDTGEPLWVENAHDDKELRELQVVAEKGIKAYLGVPVRRKDGSVAGALAVMSQEPMSFQAADSELLTILGERVGAELERQSYDHELRELKEKFHRLSIMDELTGAYNREFMLERLDKELKRAKRYRTKFSLAMFDLDHFKVINDKLGTVFGDLVLKEASLELKNCIRDVDLMARYGGEEFAIILPETDIEAGVTAADRICTSVREHSFADDRHPTRLTISAGVASYPPQSNSSAEIMIDRADEALCNAKRDGGDCVRQAV